MDFGFETRQVAGIPLVAVRGDLDGMSVDEFEEAIMGAAQSADNCVVVDLKDATYIDSQSFGRLLRIHVALERVGGDLAIVAGGNDVSRIVRVFSTDCLLGVFDDEESAAAFLLPLLPHDG
jgi:anti-anti-sigma factor